MMKIILAVACIILSSTVYSSELSISFKTKNLNLDDAQVSFTLESQNPLCSKVHVGIGGIAIAPSSIEFKGEVIKDSNRLILKADYKTGGFCSYELAEVDLQFIHKKYYYFWTTIFLTSKESSSGSILDLAELSTNQNAKIDTICVGKGRASYSMCKTYNNGKSISSGSRGSLYIWKENLREIDAYHGGNLILEIEK